MKQRFLVGLCALVLCAGVIITPKAEAAYMKQGDSVDVSSAVTEDAFLMGGKIDVSSDVFGELFAVGETVTASRPGGRSIWLAGSTVIAKGSAYNAFVAGQTVTLSGEYGNDVYVAGQTVTIDESVVVTGDLRIAADTVSVKGKVLGDVYLYASTATLNAEIGGTVHGDITKLTFTGGKVGGDVLYNSNDDAVGTSTAQITGKVERSEPRRMSEATPTDRLSFAFLGLISWLLFGLFIVFFGRRAVEKSVDKVAAKWVASGFMGLAFLFLAPIVGLVLMVTGIGIYLSLFLFFGYFVIVMVAAVVGMAHLGRLLLRWWKIKTGMPMIAGFVLALLVMTIALMIPFLSGLAFLAFGIAFYLPAIGGMLYALFDLKNSKED